MSTSKWRGTPGRCFQASDSPIEPAIQPRCSQGDALKLPVTGAVITDLKQLLFVGMTTAKGLRKKNKKGETLLSTEDRLAQPRAPKPYSAPTGLRITEALRISFSINYRIHPSIKLFLSPCSYTSKVKWEWGSTSFRYLDSLVFAPCLSPCI